MLNAGTCSAVVVSARASVEERSVMLYRPPFISSLEVPIRTVVLATDIVMLPGRPIGKMLAEMSLVIEPGWWPLVADSRVPVIDMAGIETAVVLGVPQIRIIIKINRIISIIWCIGPIVGTMIITRPDAANHTPKQYGAENNQK